MPHTADSLADAREAASRGAWRTTYDAFTAADAEELAPRDLELFAEAAWWGGMLEEAIATRERAYAAYSAAGDDVGAARVALALWWDHSGRGTFAVAQGWFATAERLLESQPETVEHGHLALFRGHLKLIATGNADEAHAEFDRAHEIGARFGDRELQALSLVLKGAALVRSGDVD